jgi:hypothetical protein
LQKELKLEKWLLHGDSQECQDNNTDPIILAKAISLNLWTKFENDFKLGLQNDAINHHDNWLSRPW